MSAGHLASPKGAQDFPPLIELVPHTPPMVLLDAVVAHGTDFVTCALTVRADAPFVGPDGVAALVSLEYMAQAAAAFAGLGAIADLAPIRWGFLIGCSELTLHRDVIPVGSRLLVESRQVWGDSTFGQFTGVVRFDDGTVISTATMGVARASGDGGIPS
jgi:predicted hotdog family 3-hydroxylacyl-ACP dehydratase